MPILRIDIYNEFQMRGKISASMIGKRWAPASAAEYTEVMLRWCGQCRVEDQCPIKSKYLMILNLHNNDYEAIVGSALAQEKDLRPKEWRIQTNGQPRCESMELIGSEKL